MDNLAATTRWSIPFSVLTIHEFSRLEQATSDRTDGDNRRRFPIKFIPQENEHKQTNPSSFCRESQTLHHDFKSSHEPRSISHGFSFPK